MNKISPRTLDLIRRVAGDETANLAAQAEAIPILCDMLEDIVQAARQEGAREALGAGPATLLDELAMAALPEALAARRRRSLRVDEMTDINGWFA